MARDEYWRWAPEVPAEVWLHYRKVGDGSQLIGAQPYGDESRIHFLVPGEGDRYTKSIMDAAQVVADDMVDGWRRRIATGGHLTRPRPHPDAGAQQRRCGR